MHTCVFTVCPSQRFEPNDEIRIFWMAESVKKSTAVRQKSRSKSAAFTSYRPEALGSELRTRTRCPAGPPRALQEMYTDGLSENERRRSACENEFWFANQAASRAQKHSVIWRCRRTRGADQWKFTSHVFVFVACKHAFDGFDHCNDCAQPHHCVLADFCYIKWNGSSSNLSNVCF